MQQLHAWMNGELVGTWSVERQLHRFHYAPQWVRSVHFRPLSLSLPLTASGELRGDAVRHYFDNLLPDNADIRERLRQRYRLASIEVFGAAPAA
ncbi:HipA N-terminal domain-containing protein [Herbaspirillum sp. B65]|uniref:HipA N-terminal domain-containing protein n=1 Tax=Herbaspirillum sp. B65 TaxID=137708 RepID=UPI00034B87BE|nr:HipA N-terminal domain-containing protein [Herbaspirillum sp. B65]